MSEYICTCYTDLKENAAVWSVTAVSAKSAKSTTKSSAIAVAET